MEKTITLIKALRLKGAPVNVNVINVAKGIVVANDRTLLIEHDGYRIGEETS